MSIRTIAPSTAAGAALILTLSALATAPASATVSATVSKLHRTVASTATSGEGVARTDTTGRIVWSRAIEGGVHLMTARADGTEPRELTTPTPDVADVDADISPDGSLVVFDRERGDTVDIMVIGIDGSGERVLDFGCESPCFDDVVPTWGPDGTEIYFTRVVGPFDVEGAAASAVLWSANLDGTDIHRVSPEGLAHRYEDYQALFLPSGELVFLRLDSVPFAGALFRVDEDGTEHQLTDWAIDADISDVSPATHGPTAGLVVFETFGHGAPDGVTQAIGTVPAYCATLQACVARTKILTPTVLDDADPRENFNPAWSPDGRSIAYTRVVRGTDADPQWKAEISVMTWDGRLSHDLTSDPGFDFRPDWGIDPAR